MMDHPDIAKVLDAGTTETGRPYFIMKLVRGIKITDYCDQNKLPTKERLDLFIKICRGRTARARVPHTAGEAGNFGVTTLRIKPLVLHI